MEQKAIQDQWPDIGTHCWGCGKNNTQGLQLKSYWEGYETVCTWQPKAYHVSWPGTLCGGVIATLIDCHCTNTANAAAYRAESREIGSDPLIGYATGSLFVKYLRPTPIDKPVVLRERVKEMEGRKITVTCSLYSGETECATGEVVAIRIM